MYIIKKIIHTIIRGYRYNILISCICELVTLIPKGIPFLLTIQEILLLLCFLASYVFIPVVFLYP